MNITAREWARGCVLGKWKSLLSVLPSTRVDSLGRLGGNIVTNTDAGKLELSLVGGNGRTPLDGVSREVLGYG